MGRQTINDARGAVLRLARILGTDKVAVSADTYSGRFADDYQGHGDPKPATWRGSMGCWAAGDDSAPYAVGRPVIALECSGSGYSVALYNPDSTAIRRTLFWSKNAAGLCEAVASFEEGLRLYQDVRGGL